MSDQTIRNKCETCQEEGTIHIEAIGCYFCASCLQKIDDRIAELNRNGYVDPSEAQREEMDRALDGYNSAMETAGF